MIYTLMDRLEDRFIDIDQGKFRRLYFRLMDIQKSTTTTITTTATIPTNTIITTTITTTTIPTTYHNHHYHNHSKKIAVVSNAKIHFFLPPTKGINIRLKTKVSCKPIEPCDFGVWVNIPEA